MFCPISDGPSRLLSKSGSFSGAGVGTPFVFPLEQRGICPVFAHCDPFGVDALQACVDGLLLAE